MKITVTRFKKIIFLLSSACIMIHSNSYAQSTARLQVLHNAGDPALATVDVYVNDILAYNDFAFRTASPYADVAAGVPVKISLAPSTSTSSAESISDLTTTLLAGSRNLAVASGTSGSGFAANPEARNINLTILSNNAAEEVANDPTMIEFNVLNGSTDLEVIDVLITGGSTVADNIGYGDFSIYTSIAPSTYTFTITNYINTNTIASFSADLSSYAGQAFLIFTSGFLTPANNNNGEPLGLFALLPNGTVVPFTSVTGVFENFQKFNSIMAYPVPSAGSLVLEINHDQAETATLEVLNMYGQTISYEKDATLIAGRNEIPLNLNNLTTGEYVIKITGAKKAGAIRCSILK